MSTAPDAPGWLAECSGTRVVVLAADGFIGSRVVRLALAAGAAVTALCLKSPWRLDGLDHPRLDVVPPPGAAWWTEAYAPELGEHLDGADALALLAYTPPAAGADATERDAHEHEHEDDVNTMGARQAADLAAASGATVIFAGSADVYGPWHDVPATEETAPSPATPYSRAKLVAEDMVAAACASRVPSVSLRISTVFGPGETGPRAIPSFVRSLHAGEAARVDGDGLDLRDYIHVDDVAAAIVNACVRPPTIRTINVSSGVGRTTLEVLESVAAALGVEPRRRHVPATRPPSRLVVDPTRARTLLGAETRLTWREDVAREVEWLSAWLDAHAPSRERAL